MPYIAPEDRKRFDTNFLEIPKTPGELNFILSVICSRYLEKHGESYKVYNEIHGVLNCMNLEFYRRTTSHYEDEKIKQNGDIFHQQKES